MQSTNPTARHRKALDVKALVVFDYAQPALWLGTALIGGGVSLYNLRNVQPVVAKDSDVALSCILVFSGGILIFQGWRLDPLLLFVQICLAGTAFTWALEAIKLRKDIDQGDYLSNTRRAPPELEDSRRRQQSYVGDRNRLPAAAENTDYGRWYSEREREEPDYEEAMAPSRGFYDGRGQEAYYPSSSGRYQAYDPADYRSFNDEPSYSTYPEEEQYPQYESYNQGYSTRGSEARPPDDYERERGREGWRFQGYESAGQQQGVREEPQEGEYSREEQVFDVYSQQENDFLPPDGEPVEEPEQNATNSRVMDEVESFYNRPESVVQDVQKFYNDRGQRIEPPTEDLEDKERLLEEEDVSNQNQDYAENWQEGQDFDDRAPQRGTRDSYSRQYTGYDEQQPRSQQRF